MYSRKIMRTSIFNYLKFTVLVDTHLFSISDAKMLFLFPG